MVAPDPPKETIEADGIFDSLGPVCVRVARAVLLGAVCRGDQVDHRCVAPVVLVARRGLG